MTDPDPTVNASPDDPRSPHYEPSDNDTTTRLIDDVAHYHEFIDRVKIDENEWWRDFGHRCLNTITALRAERDEALAMCELLAERFGDKVGLNREYVLNVTKADIRRTRGGA